MLGLTTKYSTPSKQAFRLLAGRVKALRAGKVQLTDSFVQMHQGEAYLYGANITPLETVSTHYVTEPTRTRKLLLNKKELAQISAAVAQKGQTCVCTALYWKGHLVKAKVGLAAGKKQHDQRDSEKRQGLAAPNRRA